MPGGSAEEIINNPGRGDRRASYRLFQFEFCRPYRGFILFFTINPGLTSWAAIMPPLPGLSNADAKCPLTSSQNLFSAECLLAIG